jgi:hypothetical protein
MNVAYLFYVWQGWMQLERDSFKWVPVEAPVTL